MTLTPGFRLGPYELVAPIGAGGMGEVYRARDSRLGRDVAVKVLPARYATDERMRERFEREAKAISQLSHPAVYSIFDVGSHEGVSYLVMELLEGQSLAERLARGPLPVPQALRVARDVCQALEAAHRKGIVHRDVKPANIFLAVAGTKLLDFGLARLRERIEAGEVSRASTQGPPLTGAGTVLGTVGYMAPEQVEGKPADARSDIFALGAVLFEMVTASRAFSGDSPKSVLAAILASDPPPSVVLEGPRPAGAREGREDVPRQGSRGAVAERRRPGPGALLDRGRGVRLAAGRRAPFRFPARWRFPEGPVDPLARRDRRGDRGDRRFPGDATVRPAAARRALPGSSSGRRVLQLER